MYYCTLSLRFIGNLKCLIAHHRYIDADAVPVDTMHQYRASNIRALLFIGADYTRRVRASSCYRAHCDALCHAWHGAHAWHVHSVDHHRPYINIWAHACRVYNVNGGNMHVPMDNNVSMYEWYVSVQLCLVCVPHSDVSMSCM